MEDQREKAPAKTDAADRSASRARLQAWAFGAGLIAFLLYRMSYSIVDLDVWHLAALARESIALGYVPNVDRFAYVPTVVPSIQHEHGAGFVYYGLMAVPGGIGLVLLRYGLTAVLLVLCGLIARERGAGPATALYLAPLALLMLEGGLSCVRPHQFSFVFVAVLLYFFLRDEAGERRWPAAAAVLFVVWLNLHGGFVVGAGLLFFYWLEQFLRGRPHRHLLVLGMLLPLLVPLNPYGTDYYEYLRHALTMPRPHVKEWGSLWRIGTPVEQTIFVLAAGIAAYAVAALGPRRTVGLSLVGITAAAAIGANRLLPFFAIVWFAYVPAWIEATAMGAAVRRMWAEHRTIFALAGASAAFVVLGLLVPFEPWRLRVPGEPQAGGDTQYYPVGAVRYLAEQRVRGNLLVPFDWGSYVMWKLHPQIKISLDSRYEVAYAPATEVEQYRFHMAEPGWRELLDRPTYRPTDLILVNRRLPIADEIPNLPGWKRVYRDGAFSLYARADSPLPTVEVLGPVPDGEFP